MGNGAPLLAYGVSVLFFLQLLHVVEPFVVSAEGEQFVVSAAFNDASFVEHAYFVGILDGREPVGDGDGGACLHKPVEGFLHQSLALGVEGGSGLVEDKNVGVLEDGTGDADALALSAGEFAAAVTHVGVVAVLTLHDEVVGVGNFGCFDDLFHRGVLDAEGDVAEEGVVEEDGFLIDVAEEAAQVGDAELADVGAVEEYLSLLHVVVAWQEVNEGGLARARLAYEGNGLSAAEGEIDVVEHVLAVLVVTERDVAQFDALLQGMDGSGGGGFLDGVYSLEDFVYALHGGHALRYVVGRLGEIFQGLDEAVEDDHVEDEGGSVDAAVVGEDEGAAVPEDEDDEHGAEEFAGGMGQGLAQVDLDEQPAVLVGAVFEAAGHLVLGGEGLDDAHAAEGFLKLRHDFAPLSLGFKRALLEFANDAGEGPYQKGHDENGEEGELPAGVEEHAEVADDEHGIFDEHVERARDGVLDFLNVTAHAGNDVALALVGEEGERQGDDFTVNAVAYVADDTGAQRYHDTGGGKVAERLQQGGHDEEETDVQQGARGTVALHELLCPVVKVVDERVLERRVLCAPFDKVVSALVDAEEELQHGHERHEREHVEHGREQVEHQ